MPNLIRKIKHDHLSLRFPKSIVFRLSLRFREVQRELESYEGEGALAMSRLYGALAWTKKSRKSHKVSARTATT